MENIKVSVIVLIYNAKATITGCLGNLLNQTLSDIEIILVDDASTDGTDMILQDAKNQLPGKVRVFRQKQNQGPGAARNVGLSVASGEYIGFVDSDDAVDVGMYEKLYALASTMADGADIADCAFYRESREGALLHFDDSLTGHLDDRKKSELIASGGFVWSKIFKRSMIEAFALRFRAEYGLEDMDFLIAAIASADTAVSTDEVLYVYHDTAGSMSKEMDFGRYYKNHIGAMLGIFERTGTLPGYDGIQDACEYCMSAMYSNILKLGYKKKNELPTELLAELIDGLRQVRFSCIKKPLRENPFYKRFDDETQRVMELADRSTSDLLSA